jgi:hypothetical protein
VSLPFGYRRTHCRKGHDYAVVGRATDGKTCRQCRLEWRREYMRSWSPERKRLATENYNAKTPELRTRLPREEVEAIHRHVGERGVAKLMRNLLRLYMREVRQRKTA